VLLRPISNKAALKALEGGLAAGQIAN
jgi:hypothetical protein